MNCSRQMNCSRGMNASGMNASNKGKSDKKYCGVCHKAGKTASEYESHYTKSVPGPKGIVTCPMILASVCNRCNQSGHFSDHCTIKKNMPFKNNRLSNTPHVRAPVRASIPATTSAATAVAIRRSENAFAALATSDDDDDVVMPLVSRPKITVEKEIESLAPNGVSFAAMLLKPAPAPIIETGFKISSKVQTLLASEEKSEKLLLAEKIVTERKYRSWADDFSDSEDENDDDNSAW
jgi:Nanos RNA binding domain